MKRTGFLVLLCLCLILGACFATAGAEGVIEISTKEQLQKLVTDVAADANNYQGKTVKLTADIDLGGDTWTPIDTFKGEFDGNGKIIRNFKMGYVETSSGKRYGFFRLLTADAKVHDLALQDVTATVGNSRFGTLAQNCYAVLTNVHIKNVTVTVTDANAWVGGMASSLQSGTKGCTVENLMVDATSGVKYVGGFAAIAFGSDKGVTPIRLIEKSHVKNFTLVGEVTVGAGGFTAKSSGGANYFDFKDSTVTDLNFTLNGINTEQVGGFIGCSGSFINAQNCSAQGIITASGMTNSSSAIGGFVGDTGWSGSARKEEKHAFTDCYADVDILSGSAMVGGFVGHAYSYHDLPSTGGNTRPAFYINCKAEGDVSNPNGVAGGFAGVADRGTYQHCTATGTVSGKVAGGFIGEFQDYKPCYHGNLKSSAFNEAFGSDANQGLLDNCSAVGTVLGTEKAGGLIGNVGQSLNGTAAEGAAGELIIINSTAAPAVIGANKNTQVDPYLNSVANSKATKMEGLRGKRTTANPTDGSKVLAMDENGDVTIPEGGANVEHLDDPKLEWIPVGSIIHRDGSITLPGSNTSNGTTTPPKTGVDSADRFIPMALLSLLCMAALVTLRRKERRS